METGVVMNKQQMPEFKNKQVQNSGEYPINSGEISKNNGETDLASNHIFKHVHRNWRIGPVASLLDESTIEKRI